MRYSTDEVRDIIAGSIQVATIQPIGHGNHSEAFCVNGEIVVKLPKHRKASNCLKTEMLVLRGLKDKLSLEIPNVLFTGVFRFRDEDFIYFASKKLHGRKLSRYEFLMLDPHTTAMNADIIAQFLRQLHAERNILPIKRRDHCLLHGDLSLNHLLFGPDHIVCGVLDFGDSRVGRPMSDFVYLLDDDDQEEFSAAFGNMVLDRYRSTAWG